MERGGEGSSKSTLPGAHRVAPDWLALRRAADHRARQTTVPAVERISSWFRGRLGPDQAACIIDLGAGTGSNQAWLAPRLTVPQQWFLLDHDAEILEGSSVISAAQVVSTVRQVGTVDHLGEFPLSDVPTLVTCAALLDLLSAREVALIAETIASSQASALLSLTVTGEVHLTPEDPADEAIASAFNAHQRRGGLLGPGAAETAAATLRERGVHVEIIQTDWVLDSAHPEFVRRYLSERAEAAVEQDPGLSQTVEAWMKRRTDQVQRGELALRIGHQDVVCVPVL